MKEKISPEIEKICPIIPIITGPTAVGKTSTSIALAHKNEGEIVSIDSRQIYKYLDIGTAKPTLRDQKGIPHHLIDRFDPSQQVSAGEYRRLAVQTVETVVSRGHLPIFVGGSGMYIKAITQGFFQKSTSDPAIRDRLQQEITERGNMPLYNRLMEIDPVTAKKIHINDAKRITRNLEIYEITGKPPSEHFKNQKKVPAFPTQVIVLNRDRDKLYTRINKRVDLMLDEGLVEETEALLSKHYRQALDDLKTLGYQEVIQYLDNDISYDAMVENLKRNTRRYAKRQLTWLRHQVAAEWIHLTNQSTAEKTAEKIRKLLRR